MDERGAGAAAQCFTEIERALGYVLRSLLSSQGLTQFINTQNTSGLVGDSLQRTRKQIMEEMVPATSIETTGVLVSTMVKCAAGR